MAAETFGAHWAGPHADIARNLPGLSRYEQNHVVSSTVAPVDTEWPIHGFVELWFRDPDAVAEAAHSEVTEALIVDEPTFMSGLTGLGIESSIIQLDAPWKVFAFSRAPSDRDQAAAAAHERLAATPGCVGCEINRVVSVMRRATLWSEPEPPVALVVAAFDTRPQAEQAIRLAGSPTGGQGQTMEIYLTQTIRIL